jgi:hypothetical protein
VDKIKDMVGRHQLVRTRVRLQLLICLHLLACCISLVCISRVYPEYHILFELAGLPGAAVVIAAFALISFLFVFAEFSFGYLAGFYFYAMIAGYLWLNCFSEFNYNHQLTGISAAGSAIAFLLPALFIRSPLLPLWTPSSGAFDRLLNGILLLAIAAVAFGAAYNFKPVVLDDNAYNFRDTLKFPTLLRYLIGITSAALLPFAFACFLERKYYWRAGIVLLLMLLLFPITLSKLALFSSGWIVVMAFLSRRFEARIAVVLPLFVLVAVGIFLFLLPTSNTMAAKAVTSYFWLVNFRAMAIPSMAMDYYNDFFSRNALTHFCQIQLLKPFVPCPYQEPIAIVIYEAFGVGGNFNASLFATEGIASVGAVFAPATAFASGLVIALGNRMSAGLPPRFILVSGAMLPQILLNVPLTVTLLTHGAAVLFLLWYVTPRTMFEHAAGGPLPPAHDDHTGSP